MSPSSTANGASGAQDAVALADTNDSVPQTTLNVGGADIVVQFTPAGMIIASEDLEALDAFQSLMESLAAPSSLQSELPTIVWLKYIEADVAAELISSVLGGSEGTISSAVDSVAGGIGGGMLGLLGMGGGGSSNAPTSKSVLTASGSVNIVPDARLNALIIHASPVDMQMIELILEKIDRQESPEDIETVSKPMLIPVIYQSAKDVAEVVKSVFGDRIAGAQAAARVAGVAVVVHLAGNRRRRTSSMHCVVVVAAVAVAITTPPRANDPKSAWPSITRATHWS